MRTDARGPGPDNQPTTSAQPRLFPEPVLERRARKDELCRPGGYAAMPLAVLERRDISPAAKVVYAALLDHLRGAGLWVYPSIARLAAMTGLNERRVRRALRTLEDLRLIEGRRRTGRVTAYAFSPLEDPPAVPDDDDPTRQGGACRSPAVPRTAEDPGQKRQGYPGQKRRGTLDKSARGTPDKSAGGNTYNKHSPKHPSKKGRASLDKQDQETPTTGTGGSEAVGDLRLRTVEALQQRIDKAYREIHGCSMPDSWSRAIERDVSRGDAELLYEIDADAIEAGRARARSAGHSFGFGHVRARQADRRAVARTADRRRRAAGQNAEAARKRREVVDAIRGDERTQKEYFDSLSAEQQRTLLERVIRPGYLKDPGIIARTAMELAWREHKKKEPRNERS